MKRQGQTGKPSLSRYIMEKKCIPDLLSENQAAHIIAYAFSSQSIWADVPKNGRCNLYAADNGLLTIDPDKITHFNTDNATCQIATKAANTAIIKNQKIASIKTIPRTVTKEKLDEQLKKISTPCTIKIKPYIKRKVGLIQTYTLPDSFDRLYSTTISLSKQLADTNSNISAEIHCIHTPEEIKNSINELCTRQLDAILIIGPKTATSNKDPIPSGILKSGGQISQFGIPTAPGNLLIIGKRGSTTLLGLPGCSRSLKRNGLNLILEHFAAGNPLTATKIAKMGVGGLLDTSIDQAQESLPKSNIAIIILAAGCSKRMGATNKLLININGSPIINYVIEAAINSFANEIIVVTGHESELIRNNLKSYKNKIKFIHNPNYTDGMSGSLCKGIDALSYNVDGAIFCQADMPLLHTHHFNRLIAAFSKGNDSSICTPTHKNQRGNPVLWGRSHFMKFKNLTGDTGAKHLLAHNSEHITEVIMNDDATLIDIDTRDELESTHLRGLAL